MGRVLMVMGLLELLAGGAVLAWGMTSGGHQVTLIGGVIAAMSIPSLISGVLLHNHARTRAEPPRVPPRTAIPAERADGDPAPLRADDDVPKAEYTGAPTEADQARRVLPTTEPAIGIHVVDGIMRRPRAGQAVSMLGWGAIPLAAGIAMWANGWRVVGLVVAIVGALGLALVISAFVILARRGATWTEQPTGAWPESEGIAEVLEVWDLGHVEPRVHGFVLRVHAGGRAWEIKIRQAVPVEWIDTLGERLRLGVRADPARQNRVAIDWAASEHPATG